MDREMSDARIDRQFDFFREVDREKFIGRQTMERMLADGVDTFVEIGPGRTLAGFLRKMSRDARVFNVAKVEDLDGVLAALQGQDPGEEK